MAVPFKASLAVLSLSVLLPLSACGSGTDEGDARSTSPAPAATVESQDSSERDPDSAKATVAIKEFTYRPATLRIHAGDTVTWVNRDAANHTVTFTDRDLGNVDE